MNFGEALELLKQGKKVTRSIWGGYWFMSGSSLTGLERRELAGEKLVMTFSMPNTIIAKLKDGGGYAPATPYQSDILAEDWMEYVE